MSNDFSSVKVGMKLWVRTGDYEGWGVVNSIQTNLLKPIHMRLNNGYYLNCNYNGKAYNDGPQVLFWNRIEIIPPPRPKRYKKVKVGARPYKHTDDSTRLAPVVDGVIVSPAVGAFSSWLGPIQAIEIEVEE